MISTNPYEPSLATKPHTDSLAKDALSLSRNSDGARAFNAPYPAFFQAACAQCRCDGTSQVRSSFAPIKAGSAKDASSLAAAS